MDKKKNIRSARETMAIFDTADGANQALAHISTLFSGDASRIALIHPDDPHIESKLKDEYSYMGQSAIAMHLWSIVLSVAAGVGFWAFFYNMGLPIFVYEAPTALLGSICVFLLIGVLVGCLVAYRPGRTGVIHPARQAIASGKWVLVTYPNSSSERDATKHYFQQLSQTV